jgi:hypothetical protein
MSGIGIQPTPKGYTLSEFAHKSDDTHFLRRLNGRRVSDFVAINAAAPYIKKRWSGVEDKRQINLILGPLMAGSELEFSQGLEAIKAIEDRHGL